MREMTMVQVVEASLVDVQDWLVGQACLPGLPPKVECRWLWLTLRDNQPVLAGKIQGASGPVVVVLHQAGMHFTSPDLVWSQVTHLMQDAGQPLMFRLVLTGGNIHSRLPIWLEWLSFVTPGEPPLFRLYVMVVLRCFITKRKGISRLIKWTLRFYRRGTP